MPTPATLPINRLEEVWLGLRFVTGVFPFLRRPLSDSIAIHDVRQRLKDRDRLFLQGLRDRVYPNPGHPYYKLLKHAGCEQGDLQNLVRTQGLEGALHRLHRHGVYLTVDEFKGRTAVIRKNLSFFAHPSQFQKEARLARLGIHTSSGGTSEGLIPVDVDYIRSRTANLRLDLEARGGRGWQHAVWGIPGGSALVHLLEYSGAGAHPVRWFSHVNPRGSGLASRYGWSARALRLASLLAGRPLPRLQPATVENPSPILSWIVDVLGKGGTPHLLTYTSPAVRLCQEARRLGLDLSGLQLTLTGEPITTLRLDLIRRTGACPVPRYGSAESGSIGYGCLRPEAPDEVHVLSDRLALIQAEEGSPGPAGSLLVTTLLPVSPFLLLNASLGDWAVMTERRCGCPLEEHGWTVDLQHIRSFEKLTVGGMTFLHTDIARIMDDLLPRQFGGEATHYQLVEEEGPDGRPRLRLFIHPQVGDIDPRAVAGAFLEAISQGHGVERVMGTVWRQAGVVEVERRVPMTTASGKISHVLNLDAVKRIRSNA